MQETEKILATTEYADEIDLGELFRIVWAGKWLIASIVALATCAAVIAVLMMPNIYRAEVLLAPNNSEGGGGLGALSSEYGGLASLAGINLGSSSSDKMVLGLEVLQSRKFIGEFIERRGLLVPLMAANNWDPELDQLVIDPDDFDVSTNTWVRDEGPRGKIEPSLQEAYEEFTDILSVSQDSTSGFVTISIEHYSPNVAKQWVDWLVEDINSTIMRQDVTEAQQAIEYLNEQIANTPLAELQNVFFNLIEDQTKTVMLAEVSSEYLLKTVDPAIAPEEKAKPGRLLIVIAAVAVSGFFAIMIQLMLSSFSATRSNRTE
jgi:uncharacterized protein involved in exopolysaccharide biosynthesis